MSATDADRTVTEHEPSESPESNKETDASKPQNAAMTFPEGGLQAWLTVAGAWLGTFSTFGYYNTFGVYQDYYTRVYLTNKTASEISWIGSFQLFLLFAIALPAGILFDYGYFKHMMVFGTLLFSFSHFMLSLAKENQYYQIFLSQGVGMGIALGLLFLPSVSIASHYFRRRRVLAMGITISGSSCGGIVLPILLNQLFQKPNVGFAWGVRAAAFLLLGCLSLATVLMTTRLPNRRQREAAGIPSPKPDFKGVLSDPSFSLTALGGFFIVWGIFFPGNVVALHRFNTVMLNSLAPALVAYLQLFAVEHGISSTLSFYSLAIFNASSLFGRTIPNFLADIYGPYNVLIISCLVSGGVLFAMFGAINPGGVIAFAIIYGFTSGAYVSLITPALISLARSPQEIGIRSGLAYFIVSFAALTGNPITGVLLGTKFDWKKPIIFSGVVVLGGTAFVILARRFAVQRKGTQFV